MGKKITKEEVLPDVEYEKLQKRKELELLLFQLESRKRDYGIVSFDYTKIPQQNKLVNDWKNRLTEPLSTRKRYYLYYGGNGSGKTAIGAYTTVLMALGEDTKKYNLPYIGSKKFIMVGTKSGSNIKGTIDPYLLGEGSITRIPPEEIEKVNYDNTILKSIILKNGCKIVMYTYDQGYENWMGVNPDFIWLDEEPVDERIFMEANARMRNLACEMMITMTPFNGQTRVYEHFIATEVPEVIAATNIYSVNSLDNPFTDKTWIYGLTDEEYDIRVNGRFENATGLVYKEFRKDIHVIKDLDISKLGPIKAYRGIDLGTSHPTGVVFLAQDEDDNLIVFDEVYRSNALLEDIYKEIEEKTGAIPIEYTVRDSAAKREGIELNKLGLKTIPADKHSKGENDMSNRRTGIMIINSLFKQRKLFISDKCKNLIKELQTHFYKENGTKDGEVVKENDDLLDALRYIIFNLKYQPLKTKKMDSYAKRFKEKYSKAQKGRGLAFL